VNPNEDQHPSFDRMGLAAAIATVGSSQTPSMARTLVKEWP
jgi:hypothetical protein